MKSFYCKICLIFMVSVFAFSEVAEKEILARIPIGEEGISVGFEYYKYYENIKVSKPLGPFVFPNGEIIVSDKRKKDGLSEYYLYKNGEWKTFFSKVNLNAEVLYYRGEYSDTSFPRKMFINKQVINDYIRYKDEAFHYLGKESSTFVLDKDFLIEFLQGDDFNLYQFNKDTPLGQEVLIDKTETSSFLEKKSKKYRMNQSGILVDINNPKNIKFDSSSYLRVSPSYCDREIDFLHGFSFKNSFSDWKGPNAFYICNEKDDIESEILIPWMLKSYNDIRYAYSFVIGEFGEIYCIIPSKPVMEKFNIGHGETFYIDMPAWKDGYAEIVVIRNHLKNYGILIDENIVLRQDSTKKSEKLGLFEKGTIFKILSKDSNIVEVDGITGSWYKVRLGSGQEGYFFGAYVMNLFDYHKSVYNLKIID